MIMKTRPRSSYPDSPHPGHGHPSDWISKPYSILFTGVVLFILIFGIAIFLGWRQLETTRHNALTADKTTANLLADLILEHNKATIGILQSYAHRPLFIAAVKNKDLAGVHRHLSDLKKNAEIDLTFVTDTRGILWANFPVFPEAIGKDLSNRDWYKGISSYWKPYISTVFKLIVGDKPLAVAVCVPIFDEKERVIGILASSQRLGFLVNALQRVPFSPYTTVNVIDRAGKILYSNKVPYQESITNYRFFPILEAAVKEKKLQIEINDPQKDQEKNYLTVVPVGDIGWTVIIERSLRDIYRSDLRRFIEISAASFFLFLLIIFFLVYLRKISLFRKTEELLQTETKLRQAEDTLRALSSRQEAILAAVPEIIMEVDNNKVYTWANSAGIEFFGEDVIGKEAASYFEDEQDTYKTVSPLFNGAEDIFYVESRQRRRDGEKRLLAWWCQVQKNESGQVTGALSSARDITDRKQAEEALRERDIRLKKLTSWVPGMIYQFTKKPDGTYCVPFTTETVKDIFGCSPQDVREDFSPIARIILPEDFDKVIGSIEYSAKHLNIWTCEYRVQIPGQSIRWILGNSTPEKLADGSITWYGFNTDITERKQAEESLRLSEENFRRSLDESPLGVGIVSEEGEILYANRMILDFFGYESIEELRETPFTKRYMKSSYAEFLDRKEKRHLHAGDSSDYEIDIVRKDGEVRHLQVWRKRVLWNSKEHYQVIYRDTTERKQADEELRTSRLQLRALATRLRQIREEERIRIAREIHDEMGGGLTGLKMDLSWLLRKMGDADPGEARVALMGKIHTSNALIDQMIHVVRRISTDLRPSILDDLGLIAALEWQLSEFTSRTEIPHEFATTFEYVNMKEDTAVAVFRIFQEALTNVVRHSRATKVAVFLREGEKSLFGDESFVLEIRDDGRGITEEEILNPESLGLLGMKERVLAFGGELSIRGEPGGGTALVLQIPRKQGEPS
jgi:PAS domain S-box-containing protein